MMQAYFQILPKENLTDGSIPPYHKVIVDGESPFAICILGDPAYPLLPFVMKEFANNSTFLVSNFYLQCALGRLKGRFGCLKRDMDRDIKYLPEVVHVFFSLHN